MNWSRLTVRKPLERLAAEADGDGRLSRALGPVALSAIGIGAIIGAGIFVTTGRAAAQMAGPAVVLSYAVAGLGCTLAALCYAEFAALVPSAGSAYTYAYATLGELFAWIIGWDLILEYAMSCAVVASDWTHYFNEFLIVFIGRGLPPEVACDPFTAPDPGWLNLPSVVITALITVVLIVGVKKSATTNAALVALKVSVVLFVIGVGAFYVVPANWTQVPASDRLLRADPAANWGLLGWLGLDRTFAPIDEATRTNFAPYAFSGIMVGAAAVFFAYIGFDAVSTHAEEAKKPQRDLPIGILVSLAVCTLMYLGVAVVLTGLEPYPKLDPNAAVASAFRHRAEQEGNWLLRAAAGLIATGALAGITSVLLITFQSQARIFLALARDGLLPRGIFGAVHPRYQTPHRATLLIGIVVALLAAFTPAGELQNMVNIGTAMAFVAVSVAVLVLRRTRPDTPRPFRCPAVTVVAPAGIAVNLFMVLFLPPETWLRLVVWLALGLVIYFAYGWRHSELASVRSPRLDETGPSAA